MSKKYLNIENQEVTKGATAYNIARQENNYYEDSLEYYFKIGFNENSELNKIYKVIKYITNKDKLKQRFVGDYSRYREMVFMCERLSDTDGKSAIVSANNLDDGYKSVISSVLNVSNMFIFGRDNDSNEVLVSKENENIVACIRNLSLNLCFRNINSRKDYVEAKKSAEEIKKEIVPYLQCSKAYGQFLQFGEVYLEPLKEVSFVDKEAKFTASDAIIPKLIQPLYGDNPECGLRELIQNACDACKEMKTKNQYVNPYVEIHLNKKNESSNWELKIRDYGLGMDENILINKYFVIGESTKRNSNENLVGQFGIGALATFLLGNNMELKTKRYDQKKILSFDYLYKLNESYDNVDSDDNEIDIKISEDENFACGTEIKTTLKEKFNNYDITSLENVLKINKWYLMSDIELKYYLGSEERKIMTLKSKEYQWEAFIEKDTLYAEYLLPDPQRTNYSIPNAKVIYNGILIEENYDLNDKYIKYRPCVNIVDRNKNIELDLSRTKVLNSHEFSDELKYTIYDKTKQSLINYRDYDKIIKDSEIKSFVYMNEYMEDIPLYFHSEGFGTYSTEAIKRLLSQGRFKKIIKVFRCFASSKSIKLTDLDPDCIYVFDSYEPQKTYISYLILSTGETVIPSEILNRYFYYADNSNSGFEMETVKHIYSCFKIPLLVENTARAIWDYHNQNKQKLFEDFFMEPKFIHISNSSKSNVNIKKITDVFGNCILKISDISAINFYDENDDIFKIDNFDVEIDMRYIKKTIDELEVAMTL